MEGKKGLVTFKQNCVKMAWAFMNIMNAVHHNGILHNDLWKDNILLHFLLNKLDIVYIVVCNWGEVGCMQEVTPSLYFFANTMPLMQGKHTSGWPYKFFLFMANYELLGVW
jgi:hypothetical protein